MSQSIVLTDWSLEYGGGLSSMDFFIEFLEKRRKTVKVPSRYAFCLCGRMYSDGTPSEERRRTATIVFVQKMSYKTFLRRTSLNTWRYRAPSVVYCATGEDGNKYYFRLSGAAPVMRNCMAYISSGKK